MDDLSILIPFKSDGGRRDEIFDWVLRRFDSLFPEAEIIIGRNDDTVFSRAKARNNAAANASGGLFLFADADIIIDHDSIVSAYNTITEDQKGWAVPYIYYTKLGPIISDRILYSDPSYPIDLFEMDREGPTHSGSYASLQLLTREQFYGVNGFDHRFVGWGAEDQAFTDSLRCLYGEPYRAVYGHAMHIYHPHTAATTTHHDGYAAGMHLWDRYRSLMHDPEAMKEFLFERTLEI